MGSQFDRDIDDILSKLGEFGPKETGWQRLRRIAMARIAALGAAIRSLPQAVPGDQMMLAAVVFIAGAFFLRYVFPGFARLVAVAGLILFVAAFAVSFNQLFGSGRRRVRWRGQVIDMTAYGSGYLNRFLFWLRSKLRGL
ncbi:MAG: hypothetical protein EXR51_03135 [Dehalococcoidia bacterium]|nr:hypothetical protein [Dehalococcoidia bacterium]